MAARESSHNLADRPLPSWPAPDPEPRLSEGEVHVVAAHLDQDDERIRALFETLSPEERTRAERLISLRDRYRFIVARGVLREILGAYLGREPRAVEFHYPRGQKPALAGDLGASGLKFNLSHTHKLALVALSKEREVGIDLEHLGRELKFMGIAKRFFSKEEFAALTGQGEESRKEAFLAIWTRKEAYLKATGRGIAVSLREVRVPTDFGGSLEPVPLEGNGAETWSLVELDPGPEFKASLVVEGGDFDLRLFGWPEKPLTRQKGS